MHVVWSRGTYQIFDAVVGRGLWKQHGAPTPSAGVVSLEGFNNQSVVFSFRGRVMYHSLGRKRKKKQGRAGDEGGGSRKGSGNGESGRGIQLRICDFLGGARSDGMAPSL